MAVIEMDIDELCEFVCLEPDLAMETALRHEARIQLLQCALPHLRDLQAVEECLSYLRCHRRALRLLQDFLGGMALPGPDFD